MEKDGIHDEQDASVDRGDDGHHHGGHHKALVPTSSPANGKSSRDEEEDRVPDSSGKVEGTIEHASDVRAQGNEAADDVDDPKYSGSFDVVRIFDVHLLLGSLDDADHLVGGVCLTTLLLHFEVSSLEGTAVL